MSAFTKKITGIRATKLCKIFIINATKPITYNNADANNEPIKGTFHTK